MPRVVSDNCLVCAVVDNANGLYPGPVGCARVRLLFLVIVNVEVFDLGFDIESVLCHRQH